MDSLFIWPNVRKHQSHLTTTQKDLIYITMIWKHLHVPVLRSASIFLWTKLSKYLHLLQDTVETGRLACSWGAGDVEAAGETLQHLLLQEAADGGSLSFSGQEPLGDGGVERLLHAVKPRLWQRNSAFNKAADTGTKQLSRGWFL